MTQLEFDLKPRGRGERPRERVDRILTSLGAALLRWAPVWMPSIVLAQVLFLGLRPALAEARRLDDSEAGVSSWEAELSRKAEAIERERRMLDDEIYRERVRRSLVVTGAKPLRLASSGN